MFILQLYTWDKCSRKSFIAVLITLSKYLKKWNFGFVLGLLAFGVKESSVLNNIFTVLNLITVGIVIVAGSIKGK